MPQARVLGHMALHYLPGDEQPARRLLELLGCTLVDNGPAPGEDGFCTVLVDGASANHADNVLFLSRVGDAQLEVEQAIRSALGVGDAAEAPAVAGLREKAVAAPESVSHLGIRYTSLDDLERVLAGLEAAAAPGGELHGRISVVKYRARPDKDAGVDARMAASPAFTGDERPAFADHWIQCFVRTDLCGFGVLAFGHTFELDYVFEPFFAAVPPVFGTRRTPA